jgi:hypothetical protein
MLCILQNSMLVKVDSSRSTPKIFLTHLRFVRRQEIIRRAKAHNILISSAILILRIRSTMFLPDLSRQGQARRFRTELITVGAYRR